MKFTLPPGLTGKAKIKYLVAHKGEIADASKVMTKEADASTTTLESGHEAGPTLLVKSRVLYDNDESKGILKRTIVANTYNWLDSHEDVHLNGLFARTIEARGKRIKHLYDHKDSVTAKVGRPIQFYEKEIKWRALGHPKNGDTMALIMESEILKDLNPGVYNEYLTDGIDQHSVRMRYNKIDLAVNDENYAQEFKVWNEVYDRLGNKEAADALGYFWAVREATLLEVSAVLWGSNELTPTLDNKQEVDPLRTLPPQPDPQRTPAKANDLLKIYSNNLFYE